MLHYRQDQLVLQLNHTLMEFIEDAERQVRREGASLAQLAMRIDKVRISLLTKND